MSSTRVEEDLFSGKTAGSREEILYDALRPKKTINIAVSGDVLLTEIEVRIIDTPEFQRLRRIKQLSTVYLVYPTAIHTRFDHSLGTLYEADKLFHYIQSNYHSRENERIFPNDKAKQYESLILLRLYALLHDITHVPFGHILEDEFHILSRHDEDEKRIDRLLSKDRTIGTILYEYFSRNLNDSSLYDRFINICKGGLPSLNGDTNDKRYINLREDAFIYDIVSNTACADLLDYIKRDSFFCNVSVNSFFRFPRFMFVDNDTDNGALVVSIRLVKPNSKQPRHDLLSELSGLLNSRYYISERVYFHHAKLVADSMIAAAIHNAIKDNAFNADDLHHMGDDELLLSLMDSDSPTAKELATMLRDRRLYKRLIQWNKADFQGVLSDYGTSTNDSRAKLESFNYNADYRSEQEDILCDHLDFNPCAILFNIQDPNMNKKIPEMRIYWEGRSRMMKDVLKDTDNNMDSSIRDRFNSIVRAHELLWTINIYIHPKYYYSHKNSELDIIKNICRNFMIAAIVTDDESMIKAWTRYYEILIPYRAEYVLEEDIISRHSAISEISQTFAHSRSKGGKELVKTKDIDREIKDKLCRNGH